ncbi:MAG: SpoIIE family protein phosphatase [Acidobacteria bacterium]|nr:SpoIIE family protein phosphatase [Acidobacteriota bacterium]
MRRALVLAFLVVAGTMAAALYLLRVNGAVNGPLGLASFDEARARNKVRVTVQKLLGESRPFTLKFSARTDTSTLRRLQQLVGLKAAVYLSSNKVPVQKWVYSALPQSGASLWATRGVREPLVTITVSSSGQILGLESSLAQAQEPAKVNDAEARRDAEDLLRFLGVDVGNLILSAYNAGENNGRQKYDFTWKAPIQGLPGVFSQYAVTLEGGFIKSFDRSVSFESGVDPSQEGNLLLTILTIASWFFLALLVLFLFIQQLRRDEIDLTHVRKISILSGGATFVAALFGYDGQWGETLLLALLMSVIGGLFFTLLWTVAESFLRQAYPEKLCMSDLWLNNTWRVRETGKALLYCLSGGLLMLALPVIAFFFAWENERSGLFILPASSSMEGFMAPGGLAAHAFFGPLALSLVLCSVFAGVLYPFLRLRFRPLASGTLFGIFFAAGTAVAVPAGPLWMVLPAAFLSGAALFVTMELGGFLCALLFIFAPLLFAQSALLLTGRDFQVVCQGYIGLGVLGLAALLGVILALKGRPLAEVQAYEPAYLGRIRERERFARELEIAKGVQERFLPKETPLLPGFSIAARCTPAMEVGGDYYDYLSLSGDRWLIVLGDVSGKGVKAAFYMTLTKGILHSVTSMDCDERAILSHLNRLFKNLSDDGTFLTLCAVALDTKAREATILSAGHNPPVFLRNGVPELLSPRGLVLGLMDDAVFSKTIEERKVLFGPGDALLLYTDGVTETMNRRQEEFGTQRLLQALEHANGLGPDALLDRVSHAVAVFGDGAPQADDLTLLAISADEA